MEEFYLEKKIYYHDTDSGGVVYYANYLKHLEEARAEFCLSRKIDTKEISEKGIIFAVAHLEIDYKAPARYMDVVRIYTNVEKIGKASVDFLQKIKREDKVLVEAKVVWVCINKDFKVQVIPDNISSKLKVQG